MASTPTRTPTRRTRAAPSPSPQVSPGPCPWKGTTLTVPGDVFKVSGTEFKAVVQGWNGRKTDSILARFDDGSQYWFPLDDALRWMDEQPGDADPPTPFSSGPQTSPGSPKKAAGLRNRGSAATASSKGDAPAADMQSGSNGQHLQQQAGQKHEAGDQQRELLSYHAAGVVCGVVLLLVVMLVAIIAARGAAHDLEAWMDGMSELCDGVKAKFAVRQSDWGSSHPQQVMATTTTVVAQETAVEVRE